METDALTAIAARFEAAALDIANALYTWYNGLSAEQRAALRGPDRRQRRRAVRRQGRD